LVGIALVSPPELFPPNKELISIKLEVIRITLFVFIATLFFDSVSFLALARGGYVVNIFILHLIRQTIRQFVSGNSAYG